MIDNTVGLSEDPNYKETVARLIAHLRAIADHIEKGQTQDALGMLYTTIESLQGEEHLWVRKNENEVE